MFSGSKRLSDTAILSVTIKELMDILANGSLNLLSPKELFLYFKVCRKLDSNRILQVLKKAFKIQLLTRDD